MSTYSVCIVHVPHLYNTFLIFKINNYKKNKTKIKQNNNRPL